MRESADAKEPRVLFGMSVSLDGYINGPKGELDWHRVDDELFEHFIDLDRSIAWHVYGRRLYETMQYWEQIDLDSVPDEDRLTREYTDVWRNLSKIVISRTLESVSEGVELYRGSLTELITRLKATKKGDISVGGAVLAGAVAAAGLLDEYHRYVTPVVLGGGTPYFSPETPRHDLELLEVQTFRSGVILERYGVIS